MRRRNTAPAGHADEDHRRKPYYGDTQHEEVRLKPGAHIIRITAAAIALLAAAAAPAQVSLSTAVDLALKNSPRIKMAQADLDKSSAAMRQARDVYIPNLVAGSGLGYTYGFPVGQPTLFNFTSQSLMFDASQFSYIRSTRAAIHASLYALNDARQQVEQDTSQAYIQLDNDLQQQKVMTEEYASGERLTSIVQQRLDAGIDSRMELTKAQLSAAQVHLRQIHLESEIAGLRDQLALLTGMPADGFITDTASIPPAPGEAVFEAAYQPPAVQAAYANAVSKQQQARGDRRQVYLPQIAFAAQFARFASFNNYSEYYGNNLHAFQYDNAAIGIVLTWPLFDRVRSAKADVSAAEAVRSSREADMARDTAAQARLKLRHSLDELIARQQVAQLDRELAQEQLDSVLVQLNSSSSDSTAVQTTPKDEQNARIAAADKSLSVLDAEYQLRQAQLDLLRATGGMELWLKSTAAH